MTELITPTERTNHSAILAELIKEKARLDEYCADPKNDDDEVTWERRDDVRDHIGSIIKTHRIITLTKWGRPVLDRAGLDHLVEGLSDEDKTLVREEVEGRYKVLRKNYDFYLAGTLAPRNRSLKPRDLIAKLRKYGVQAVWDDGHWKIANPTYTQCLWIDSEGETEDWKKGTPIDHLQLITNNDEYDPDRPVQYAVAERNFLEMTFGREAATGPTVDLVPLIQEIYGDEMAAGEEALRLMGNFEHWMSHFLGFKDRYSYDELEEAA